MPACAGKRSNTKVAEKEGSTRRRVRSLTACGKERLENCGAIGSEDASGDLHLMVEARVREDFEAGADGTTFGIVGAVDEARDTGLDDGTRAHAARLDGDVQRGIREAVVGKTPCPLAKDEDFGVRRGVAIADGAIAGAGENLAVVDEQGADGNFAGRGRGVRFSERFLHELDVSFHLGRENNTREEENRN
jgi:hypothetical protein